MYCNLWIIDDNMVSWNLKTKKGFCRKCSKKLSYNEVLVIEKDGFNFGEQLSFFKS